MIWQNSSERIFHITSASEFPKRNPFVIIIRLWNCRNDEIFIGCIFDYVLRACDCAHKLEKSTMVYFPTKIVDDFDHKSLLFEMFSDFLLGMFTLLFLIQQ